MTKRARRPGVGVRFVIAFISLVFVAQGIAFQTRVLPFGQNYWGGQLFGPISIAIGVLLLYITIFRWKAATTSPEVNDLLPRKKRYPTLRPGGHEEHSKTRKKHQ